QRADAAPLQDLAERFGVRLRVASLALGAACHRAAGRPAGVTCLSGAAAVEHHEGSWRQIARTFRVSLSFITCLRRRHRPTRDLSPAPQGGGHPPALDEAACQRLHEAIRARPDATLQELRQRLRLSCSLTALWRTLRRLRITRKKKTRRHEEQERP